MKSQHLTKKQFRVLRSLSLPPTPAGQPTLAVLSESMELPKETVAHLQQCEECRIVAELFLLKPESALQLPVPPDHLAQRACAIMQQGSHQVGIRQMLGKVLFDSWQLPAVLGVRGRDPEKRRLTVELASGEFELQAAKDESGWLFSGRCSGSVPPVEAIKVGKQQVIPDDNGFFTWESTSPPRTIRFVSSEHETVVRDLLWRVPRP